MPVDHLHPMRLPIRQWPYSTRTAGRHVSPYERPFLGRKQHRIDFKVDNTISLTSVQSITTKRDNRYRNLSLSHNLSRTSPSCPRRRLATLLLIMAHDLGVLERFCLLESPGGKTALVKFIQLLVRSALSLQGALGHGQRLHNRLSPSQPTSGTVNQTNMVNKTAKPPSVRKSQGGSACVSRYATK